VTISAFASQPDNGGISGGTPGTVNYNVLIRDSDLPALFAAGHIPTDADEVAGEREVIPAKARSSLDGADLHLYLQSGGGGFGDPLRREPERVATDVRHGLVSPEVAADVYGVVLGEGGVEEAATAAARERIRGERLAGSEPLHAGAGAEKVEGGELLHRVADTVEAVRVDGVDSIRCSECHTRFGGYEEDYKAGTVVRELPFTALGRLNELAPDVGLAAREYCCPGCGTALAIDIQAPGEPPLAECAFGAAAAVPPGGRMTLPTPDQES
jgi:N-methylhydantoinase B